MESVLRFRNVNFWFSWRDVKAFRSGVTVERKKENTFHWSVVSVHFEYSTVVSRTFSVLCPRNWRDLYGNRTKFCQANQRTISYVPDLLVVTKRHKGKQATHHGDILLRSPLWFRNRYDKFKLKRETPHRWAFCSFVAYLWEFCTMVWYFNTQLSVVRPLHMRWVLFFFISEGVHE